MLDRAIFQYISIQNVRLSGVFVAAIDDCAKDGGEELITKMHRVRIASL